MMKWLPLILLGLVVFVSQKLWAEDMPGLKEPLRTVTVEYLVIEQKLSADTFDASSIDAATKIKTLMAAAPDGTFAPDFIQAVNVLAEAKSVHEARVAFAPVSDSLIAALALNKIATGELHSAFCPMRKAYWVQKDGKTVQNPYFGSAMLDCGEIQRNF